MVLKLKLKKNGLKEVLQKMENNKNDHMYFIEMGIREFAQEAIDELVEEFNLDHYEVKSLFDDIIERVVNGG